MVGAARRTLTRACIVAGLLASVAHGTAWAEAPPRATGTPVATPPPAAPSPGVTTAGALSSPASASPPLAAQVQAGAAADAFKAKLNSADAVRHRRESRKRFRALDGADALALAKTEYSDVVTQPAWSPPTAGNGEKLGKYVTDNAQLVSRDDGRKAVAVSRTPLVSTEGNGKREPVDLTLEHRTTGFAPENAVVPTLFGHRLGTGVSLHGGDVVLDFVGAADRSARTVDDKLFYDNAYADVDVLAEPLPMGAETFYQLRSPAAPESFALDANRLGDTFRLTAD